MAKTPEYDLVIVGAGSGGLTAAEFAVQLGARVALVEQARIGGDCTWSGCVPSKALLKVAKVAHAIRTAGTYGLGVPAPAVDMPAVRAYLHATIATIAQTETADALRAKGIDVILAAGRFLDPQTLAAGDRRLTARAFLLCTGAHPVLPAIPGLSQVPHHTYLDIFENIRLPAHLVVLGAGPLGMELAQAYRRLGAAVTVIGPQVLPRDEPEAGATLTAALEREGVRFLAARATAVAGAGQAVLVTAGAQQVRGDMLLVATGRAPVVTGLDLERAGVAYTAAGITVDAHLRTSAKHIFAAGDCTGGYQYTHFAGWQAFQAMRNALLPGNSAGARPIVPWVTFTDPEVAHAGATEAAARRQWGAGVVVRRWALDHTDRAICDNDPAGFLKIVHKADGTLLGATLVGARAGEALAELVLALERGLKVSDLASPLHAYPTYSTAVQQLAAQAAVEGFAGSLAGQVLRRVAGLAE